MSNLIVCVINYYVMHALINVSVSSLSLVIEELGLFRNRFSTYIVVVRPVLLHT